MLNYFKDFLKRKVIKTNEASDLNRYNSSGKVANIALGHAKDNTMERNS
jgi:hypothetical protein